MEKSDLKKYNLPDAPGVYQFIEQKGNTDTILYIGKATSLQDRVRSYFSNDLIASRGPRLVDVVTRANRIVWEETDSVLEALILESLLIKKYQPKYNAKEKDDKSYLYVVITDEQWPRVLIVRGSELSKQLQVLSIKKTFGPFVSKPTLERALAIIQKIFPFYDTKQPITRETTHNRAKIEFNTQIGKYPRNIRHEEYLKNIRHISLFLSGKKKHVVATLEREMKQAAREEKFEQATVKKKQMYDLQHINDITLIREDLRRVQGVRVEAYDIAHTAGTHTVGGMVVLEDGELQPKEYRKFTIKEHTNNDAGALRELLERRFAHTEWQYPKVIVVDGGRIQENVAHKVLEDFGLQIPVMAVTKNEQHNAKHIRGFKSALISERDVLLANAEAHRYTLAFHKKKRGL